MRKRGMASGASAARCLLARPAAGARGNGLRTGLAGRVGAGLEAAGQYPYRQYHGARPMRGLIKHRFRKSIHCTPYKWCALEARGTGR